MNSENRTRAKTNEGQRQNIMPSVGWPNERTQQTNYENNARRPRVEA